MIKLKTKIIGYDDKNQYVKVTNYKANHSNTIEHLCAINVLVESIIKNDEDMNIDKLCRLIKSNYKKLQEMREY